MDHLIKKQLDAHSSMTKMKENVRYTDDKGISFSVFRKKNNLHTLSYFWMRKMPNGSNNETFKDNLMARM